jgi:regulatory protein
MAPLFKKKPREIPCEAMTVVVRRSLIDPNLLEVVEGEEVICELEAPFKIWKIPRGFESLDKVKGWLKETERKLTKNAALRLLSAKSQASKDLLRKLEMRGYSPEIASEIVDEMKRLGYLNDAEFVDRMIESELRKGHGPKYIEMKLRSLGLSSERVRVVVTDERQRERIRKLGKKVSPQALARRGFDLDLVFSELKNSVNNR